MDDLIVIILTLLIAVVGIIGQTKKKKQVPPTSENKHAPENIWDLLQQEMEPKYNVPEPEFFEEKETEKIYESVDKVQYQFVRGNEGKPEVKKDIFVESPVKKLIKKEKFSLKKAVIYSEILNRKYI
ncbi:MAG: hypothetical protein R2757_10415 [Draconibacterium sp.]